MRVSIMGQAAFGEAVFQRLSGAADIEVAGVSAPAPRGDARPDPLWAAASAAALPAVDTATLKEPAGLRQWASLEADLCVMAFVTDIIPADALAVPRLGTIQYHPSLLPLHRGSSAINWAIINGDAETGLSIFWPDQGIDTGPVLSQKRIPIGPRDTVGSLYFDHLFPLGVEAIAEAIALVARGAAPRLEQNHASATYEPPCTDEHAQIRWHEPAERVSALIRVCNPQPGAWTTVNGEKLRLFDCHLTGQQEPGMPGKLLRIADEGRDIRLNGGVLRVARVQLPGQKKVAAAEWAKTVPLRDGFRFR